MPTTDRRKVGIITFHDTPNFGATLQCYALHSVVSALGHDVEVINYRPLKARLQYLRFLFLGQRRAWCNVGRVRRFAEFARTRLNLSGRAIGSRRGLAGLATRYAAAITGSDEVWKIDHMRPFDPSFYLDFCDTAHTRLISYAASASAVTDLGARADDVAPLLRRFTALAVRDERTREQVRRVAGLESELVVDPTFLWDWSAEDLPPIHPRPYVAVYAWTSAEDFRDLRRRMRRDGKDIVCVGCTHPDADANYLAIGPEEWLRLLRHSDLVVTDFFHGAVFALIFGRPLFVKVDPAKRTKLASVMELAGLATHLHESYRPVSDSPTSSWNYDPAAVNARLAGPIAHSHAWLAAALRGL